MGKFKMPTVQKFLEKKTICPKKEPVWVYLEREMKQNLDKKPYNEKVGAWLKFLKELRYYYYCEAQRKARRLEREVGPAWYCELSMSQRHVLSELKSSIHQDLLEDLPIRTRKSLSDLGFTTRVPKKLLMQAMKDSIEDPGVFIWNLYTTIYKQQPSEMRGEYDMNAMVLMSCLVFIDLDECTDRLEKLTAVKETIKEPVKIKQKKNTQPNIRYGEYQQKMYVPCYLPKSKKKKNETPELGYKFRLRSQESYERLCRDNTFLLKRKERNKKEQQVERICNYKFWEPPSNLRNTNPKMAAYVEKLKMLKMKAKPRFKAPYENIQFAIGGVAFARDKPQYVLAGLTLLPTGYIPINSGLVDKAGDLITCIGGYWKYPSDERERCDDKCDCMKWEPEVMEYLKKTKCKCGHLYDFQHEGKVTEKYFYPPNRNGPFWIDKAKVYMMDPTEDFIKDTVQEALRSVEVTPQESQSTIPPSALKESVLLQAFLADLSDTPLLIPHLPQANLLNNLQEWVRRRVKGKLTRQRHRQMHLQSLRRWLDLKHMDFRARAYSIPFTLKQLQHMNWSHRKMVQKLFEILLDNFVTRNRLMQLEQTRLWWSTMKYDTYPGKAFLDVFFTYMPGRMKDTFLLNPFSAILIPKGGAKTCPLPK